MRSLTGTPRIAAVVALAALVAGVGLVAADAVHGDTVPKHTVLGPGDVTIRIRIHDSSFSPRRVHVAQHTNVRFVLVNRDPIAHEFIVGPPDVHKRHEGGHEAWHPAVPGEVSIPAAGVAETTYLFHEVGPVLFACHLPGHLAFGMKGTVVVRATTPAVAQ